MAKAIFNRRFDATDTKRGISIRIDPRDAPQSYPEWVVALAVDAGAATRHTPTRPAAADNDGD